MPSKLRTVSVRTPRLMNPLKVAGKVAVMTIADSMIRVPVGRKLYALRKYDMTDRYQIKSKLQCV